MTTDFDFALLEVPLAEDIDPDEYLRAAVQWHFGADTGSPYWLERAKQLDFDPRTDIKTFDDLVLFPNIVDELRAVAVEDLIPRGYGPGTEKPLVFESGGTTGLPKRVIFMPGWLDYLAENALRRAQRLGLPMDRNKLLVLPSGPHFVGARARVVAELSGTIAFTVDLDPRWVKRLQARGKTEEILEYTDHLLDQAVHILRTQDVGELLITPPLLRALTKRLDAVDLVKDKIEVIWWGGAHMSIDDRYEFSTIYFPGIKFFGGYGSTMVLGGSFQRAEVQPDEDVVFDTNSPIVTFRVVDPETGEAVPYGRRGRVVMNHVSKGMFLPNNLERDTAIRVPAPAGHVGDSVSSPEPVAVFGGEPVIEGIY